VFVLHDLFDLPYAEIATVVDRSEATCRQIAARARRHVAERRRRFDPPSERRDELVRGFFAALDAGDVAGLEKLLAEDVVFVGDGGGKGPAVKHPITGTLRVARFMAGLIRAGHRVGALLEPSVVNGSPGLRVLDPAGQLVNVLAIDFRDGRVAEIRSIINPDKMQHLGPVADAAELLRQSQPGGNAR
jgi:Sigma-70, region 4/SnoaL-like domain